MNVQNLVTALEASLQAEIGAKAQEIDALQRQEAAIRARDVDGLARASHELQALLQKAADRATRRTTILADLSRALGLTGVQRVARIVEALGPRGLGLAARRAELRDRCAATLKLGRRVSALVRLQASIVEEALGRFLAPDPSGAPLGRGSLVDAEA
jgi:hypothetical protein